MAAYVSALVIQKCSWVFLFQTAIFVHDFFYTLQIIFLCHSLKMWTINVFEALETYLQIHFQEEFN